MSEELRSHPKNTLRLWIGLLALGLVIALGFLLFGRFRATPATLPLPSPNGYEDLVRAGEAVVGDWPDFQSTSPEELADFVKQNQVALEIARVGLSRECRVPMEYAQSYMQTRLDRNQAIRQLAWALIAEGKLAENQGRNADASQSYVDTVRLGHEMVRGGLLVEKLTGVAAEALGVRELHALHVKLTAEDCHGLIRALETIDRRREPFEEVIVRERMFTEAALSNLGLQGFLARRKLRRMARQTEGLAERAVKRGEARLSLVIAELGIRRYFLENGAYPESLSELVPSHIAAIRQDPFGGRPMVYRVQQAGYQLYSIGPNLKDDGGIPLPAPPASDDTGDLFLDSEPAVANPGTP